RPSWEGARLDAFTGAIALEYTRTRHPRLVYVAFNDTDDLSHSRRYDRLLDALNATDGFLKELWTTIQAEPAYRGRTTLIVTTDHGRGRRPEDWSDHGSSVAGAEDIWILLAGAGIAPTGEATGGPPARQAQIAATVVGLLGLPEALLGKGADPALPLPAGSR
ncbi:MAG: alkaline phosphatase family protein, partial [Gemmatimonadota bacterium]|nr:alkaline phosphatase family protein [Gemmatimonadota bacterium]